MSLKKKEKKAHRILSAVLHFTNKEQADKLHCIIRDVGMIMEESSMAASGKEFTAVINYLDRAIDACEDKTVCRVLSRVSYNIQGNAHHGNRPYHKLEELEDE